MLVHSSCVTCMHSISFFKAGLDWSYSMQEGNANSVASGCVIILYRWNSIISPVIFTNLSHSLPVSYTVHCSVFPCPPPPPHSPFTPTCPSTLGSTFTATHSEHAAGDQSHAGVSLLCFGLLFVSL